MVALVDVDALRRNERRAKESEDRAAAADRRADESLERRDYAEAVIDAVSQPLLVLSADLKVRSANTAFRRRFHLQPGDGAGRPVAELLGGAVATPAFIDLFRRALADEAPDGQSLEFETPGVAAPRWSVRARKLHDGARRPLLLVALEKAPARRPQSLESPSSQPGGDGNNDGEGRQIDDQWPSPDEPDENE